MESWSFFFIPSLLEPVPVLKLGCIGKEGLRPTLKLKPSNHLVILTQIKSSRSDWVKVRCLRSVGGRYWNLRPTGDQGEGHFAAESPPRCISCQGRQISHQCDVFSELTQQLYSEKKEGMVKNQAHIKNLHSMHFALFDLESNSYNPIIYSICPIKKTVHYKKLPAKLLHAVA